jgi:DNA-directed RNA polymerase specialized sigma24 family protein
MSAKRPPAAVVGNRWALTQEAFDSLLDWLAPEREEAGRRYEIIRQRLIKIFSCRSCREPEDLADETINRVARKVGEVAKTYTGNPALYFYGVANKVHLESLKKKAMTPPPLPAPSTDEAERAQECLERCISRLTPENRRLVVQYYQEEKSAKIGHRQALADQFGIALNALRIRAHRIRITLRQCVQNCLTPAPLGNETNGAKTASLLTEFDSGHI